MKSSPFPPELESRLQDALTTAQELAAAREFYRGSKLPAPALAVMDAATAALESAGAARNLLAPGSPAPDFILPDASARPVRPHSLLTAGPVVLVFYRGGWCPYCNLHLRGFQKLLPQFHAAGAQVVAVSPQLPDHSLSTQEKNELAFPVLSDVGLHAARAFGAAFELPGPLLELYVKFGHPLSTFNGAEGATQLPLPATFILRPDRTVAYSHGEADYTRRSEPADILRLVSRL